MYKCVIIDDETYAAEGLTKFVDQIPNLTLIRTYSDPLLAMNEIIAGDEIDMLLMDIDMPKINGLELAREIRQKTKKLVFTTSHTSYGYQAFDLEADGYLLKPYSFAKFAGLMSKLFPIVTSLNVHEQPDDYFFVKDKNDDLKIIKVRFADVIAVESQQNYVFIHSLHKKILTYMSLTEIAKTFNRMRNFAQFQRSFILNKDHIESINGNMIKMVNGVYITVGEHYRKDYTAFLEKNLIKAKRKE